MTIENLSCRVRNRRIRKYKPGPKYNLIEREITPEQQRAKFIKQDKKFCDVMLKAISDGFERPWR